MSRDTVDVMGVEMTREQFSHFYEWLNSEYSNFFFAWVRLQSKNSHDLSSKPPTEIMDLVKSQRLLASENAYDQVLNFSNALRDIGISEKIIKPTA